jgi:hypothetical protein
MTKGFNDFFGAPKYTVMQREAVTVMPSYSGEVNIVVA